MKYFEQECIYIHLFVWQTYKIQLIVFQILAKIINFYPKPKLLKKVIVPGKWSHSCFQKEKEKNDLYFMDKFITFIMKDPED